MNAKAVQSALDQAGDPADAQFLQRFFKTGKGQYGEGDQFIGVRMPAIRKIAQQYKQLPLAETVRLLHSPVHEHRMCALVIMTLQAKTASKEQLQTLYQTYLANTAHINNWDLVDVTCRDVVGRYLSDKPRDQLYELANSPNMWERRIAIVSTWWFIRDNDLNDTFALSEILLHDKHDLMHKAVGWMLREAGKKDETRLKEFLDVHAVDMPRTMLRYSLEKLHPKDRQHYMQLKA